MEGTKTKQKSDTLSGNGAIKSPKVRQVQAFYRMLSDIGFDEWISESLNKRSAKIEEQSRKVVTAAEQVKGSSTTSLNESDLEDLASSLDIGKIMSHLGNGGLVELTCIVMDCEPEEAEEYTLEELDRNFTFFAMALPKPFSMLLGFGQSMA